MKMAEQVLQLYRETYFDFNVKHFQEKLQDEHGIEAEQQLGEDGPAKRRGWRTGARSPDRTVNGARGERCRG